MHSIQVAYYLFLQNESANPSDRVLLFASIHGISCCIVVRHSPFEQLKQFWTVSFVCGARGVIVAMATRILPCKQFWSSNASQSSGTMWILAVGNGDHLFFGEEPASGVLPPIGKWILVNEDQQMNRLSDYWNTFAYLSCSVSVRNTNFVPTLTAFLLVRLTVLNDLTKIREVIRIGTQSFGIEIVQLFLLTKTLWRSWWWLVWCFFSFFLFWWGLGLKLFHARQYCRICSAECGEWYRNWNSDYEQRHSIKAISEVGSKNSRKLFDKTPFFRGVQAEVRPNAASKFKVGLFSSKQASFHNGKHVERPALPAGYQIWRWKLNNFAASFDFRVKFEL